MSPRLYGPFKLTSQAIEAHLQADSPGVFALGAVRNNLFIISYIGRADADLRKGLRDHVPGPYSQFKFTYATSARDAFQKHCELYHDYVGLDNREHPCPPRSFDMSCPRCRLSRPD